MSVKNKCYITYHLRPSIRLAISDVNKPLLLVQSDESRILHSTVFNQAGSNTRALSSSNSF